MGGEVIGVEEADLIHEKLGKLVGTRLPDAVVAYTSGSLPYGAAVRGHSDIDINIVLPAGTVADRTLFGRLARFIVDYLALHDQHGMRLDRRYPGEYFTLDQAHDAATGRGIPVVNGRPRLPGRVGDSYWDASEETWYLAWLGASAFSRHVAGDPSVLAALRRQAWATVAAACLPDLMGTGFRTEDVVARVLECDHPSGGFGVHPGYRRFAELEIGHCEQALADLASGGVLKRPADGIYSAEPDGLLRWSTDLASRHRTGFHATPLLTVASSLRLTV